ncbi:MAG: nitrogenase iron-molybdenum cofactor biosynthesis protein NifE [Nitrospirae bacterium]|nr:nitrogenase iron-molybdenum cofactor biosynthesis protein NifE [Nitrospirota bacterium]
MDRLTEHGCGAERKDKVCRSRGGESCAFDGAMIVLQPIADAAHLVHGPIACCGNSWEGRGALSHVGARHAVPLHKMGFTTDMNELDIVYGSEEKLLRAILRTFEAVRPKAIFVYATCVSGLTGEDIEAVCRKAETELDIKVIPVNAPGFVGPKNLGNRIAGEVLLNHVIGTGEPPDLSSPVEIITPPAPSYLKRGEDEYISEKLRGVDINLIGEYNIGGDLWVVEPVLRKAGLSVLSRITGDSAFEEITYAHRAKLNVVVCSRALINVAVEMERRYGIPYIEVSFFGKTEMSKALRLIARKLEVGSRKQGISEKVEAVITHEEKVVDERLSPYSYLRGKKAVLYTGGVKSWSFISALLDLGIEVVGVGTKKSTYEDEKKMKEILGADAPLLEDVTPKNLLKTLREHDADILVAGGRNQYLAVKEGYPFVDVNQERHIAYAGYEGLVNLAEQIHNSIRFYAGTRDRESGIRNSQIAGPRSPVPNPVLINPLKHSPSIGAAMALQGIHRAIPVIHGAQGCTFLGKVLLTRHFREPIALAGSKLFAEDVVMGSEDALTRVIDGLLEKNSPDVIGILTSGLSEVKGDDIASVVKIINGRRTKTGVIHVPTPDYDGSLETGYSRATEALLSLAEGGHDIYMPSVLPFEADPGQREIQINVLAGPHLTPADVLELREIIEAFGMRPIILPDLSALDGSREGVSPLATGGTTVDEIRAMGSSEFTIAVGPSMEQPARLLKEKFGIEYRTIESLSGLKAVDHFLELVSMLSGCRVPKKYERQRRVLVDGMRDAHFYTAGRKAALALEPDQALQMAKVLAEMGMDISLVVTPVESAANARIAADCVRTGDLFSLAGEFDIILSNSHAKDRAKELRVPLLHTGFPVFNKPGNTAKMTLGYRGTLELVNDIANLLAQEVHS